MASVALVAIATEATRTTPPSRPTPRPAAAPIVPEPPPPVALEPTPSEPLVNRDDALFPAGEDDEVRADPLEMGDAKLRVRLRGDRDGVPVAMNVRVWRLGVAESENWTAGDEVQAELPVAQDGVSVAHLPPGRYRVQCLDLRDVAADPPAFVVASGDNEAALDVANRRTVHLRLRVMDADGSSVRSVRRFSRSRSSAGESHDDAPTPDWAQRRRPKRQQGARTYFGTGSPIVCGFGGTLGVAVDAIADGSFDLGTQVERGRTGYRMWIDDYVRESGGAVRLDGDDKIAADTTFLGVAPRLDVLVAHVTCPDGSALDPTTAKIEAKSDAVRCPWTPPADAWRTIPVHVKVVKDGCEPLTFDWTAATGDAEHRLVAAPAESPK